jgi:ribosomal protein S18 acetylase RimI-like enzyme
VTVSNELPPGVTIGEPTTEDAETLADLWVELAADQREYGSHLRTDGNRAPIHETMLQHVVAGTVRVARRSERRDGESTENGSEEQSGSEEQPEADTETGSIVGFVTFGVEGGKYEQDCSRGFIHNVYVRENHRGGGIGGELVATAERALESSGIEVVALQAMAGNEAALSFYRDRGYTSHRVELEKPIKPTPLNSDEG